MPIIINRNEQIISNNIHNFDTTHITRVHFSKKLTDNMADLGERPDARATI